MRIGVSTASFYPMLTEEALLLLAKGGVKNVEIFINCNTELMNPIRRTIGKIISDYSLNVLSVHPMAAYDSFFLFSNYERRQEQYMELHRHCLDCMSEWGSDILVFHGLRNDSSKDDDFYFERYLKLTALAEQYGVTVAQENIAYCKSGRLSFLKKMKCRLGEKAAFTLDLKQAIRSGESPFDYLSALKGSIVNVHASDNGSAGDCLPIGDGNFNFNDFFRKLRESGFTRGVVLELYSDGFETFSDITQSVNKLQMFANSD